MLVISAACRVHAVKYVLSLSIHSLSSVSFCLHSVLRLRMCALDFMHKLFLISFVPLCVYVGRVCACVSLVYESWRLLKTLRSKHTLVRFYNTSHIHMLKNTQKHFQSHIDRRQRSKSIFFSGLYLWITGFVFSLLYLQGLFSFFLFFLSVCLSTNPCP